MALKNDFFIGVYTNEVKDYCDKKFFDNLGAIKVEAPYIIDNSSSIEYLKKLKDLAPWAHVRHIDISEEPKVSRFQRNVCESVNFLRDIFLAGSKQYFLIVESDVIPPKDLLTTLVKGIEYLDHIQPGTVIKSETEREYIGPWGAIGGLYYEGFHDYSLTDLRKTHHVLSGCTVYKRELIEKFPFRYDPDLLGAFPDALISHDSNKEFSLWNDHSIRCKHEHTSHGTRISRPL